MTMPNDDEITNTDRAERCHAALEQYNDAWDVLSNLIDFLTDARHWCDLSGKSYAEFDHIAYQHYATEVVHERRRV